MIPLAPHLDLDRTTLAAWKSIFQRIGNQLVDDQTARDSGVHRQPEIVDRSRYMNTLRIDTVGAEQVIGELVNIGRKINFRKILRLVKALVNQSHGMNPVLAFLEHPAGGAIFHCARLESQKAGDHLKIILDPMVNLLQK